MTHNLYWTKQVDPVFPKFRGVSQLPSRLIKRRVYRKLVSEFVVSYVLRLWLYCSQYSFLTWNRRILSERRTPKIVCMLWWNQNKCICWFSYSESSPCLCQIFNQCHMQHKSVSPHSIVQCFPNLPTHSAFRSLQFRNSI